MINVNLKFLVDKMFLMLWDVLEGVVGFCIGCSYYNVEVEYWLFKLLEVVDCDFGVLLECYEIEFSWVVVQFIDVVEKFQIGSVCLAVLVLVIVDVSKNVWMISLVDFGYGRIISGYLLVVLMLDE